MTTQEPPAGSTPAAEDAAPAPGAAEGAETLAGLPHLPAPTIWPATLAAGVTLLCAGVATTPAISVAGAATMALALGGWVQELRRDARRAAHGGEEDAHG